MKEWFELGLPLPVPPPLPSTLFGKSMCCRYFTVWLTPSPPNYCLRKNTPCGYGTNQPSPHPSLPPSFSGSFLFGGRWNACLICLLKHKVLWQRCIIRRTRLLWLRKTVTILWVCQLAIKSVVIALLWYVSSLSNVFFNVGHQKCFRRI